MSNHWILYDGKFFAPETSLFSTADLSRILFSESIRSVRNLLPFWNEHLANIQQKFSLLNQPLPAYLENDGKELKRQIERFLSKNKLFKSALLTIQFFAQKEKTSYLITHEEITSTSFPLNANGHILEISQAIQKPASPESSQPIITEAIWKVIAKQTLSSPITALLITNTSRHILETPEKNIYLLKGNHVITPSPAAGAYRDVCKNYLEEILNSLNFHFEEVDQISPAMFLEAEEVFLASGLVGIEWVKGFYEKRYFNKTIKKISDAFNEGLIE